MNNFQVSDEYQLGFAFDGFSKGEKIKILDFFYDQNEGSDIVIFQNEKGKQGHVYDYMADDLFEKTNREPMCGYSNEFVSTFQSYYKTRTTQKESAAQSSTLIERKVGYLTMTVQTGRTDLALDFLKQEQFAYETLGKDIMQLIIDAALDVKDYELLSYIYS